jgi:3-(3-hydroxy-phenyl)propionate hydroxylase
LKDGEDPQLMATPTETWRLLSRWITPQDGQLWRQSSYRFHALVAAQWRRGRVFLAGDSAHMQPPFLGQGMCQGVRDAVNLAWKLIAVQQGRVRSDRVEDLLDSYAIERKAHVIELTSRIKMVGEVICERDLDKARARDAKLLAECGGVVPDTPRQDVMPHLHAGMLSNQVSDGRGMLFPQPRLLDGGLLMDDVLGHGWRWVTDGEWPVHDLPRDWVICDLTRQAKEQDGVVLAWLRLHGAHAALVRPDHRVFGVATNPEQAQRLRDDWQSWMCA